MTKQDADTIRRAALIMPHVVAPQLGDTFLSEGLKYLPVDPADVAAGRINDVIGYDRVVVVLPSIATGRLLSEMLRLLEWSLARFSIN